MRSSSGGLCIQGHPECYFPIQHTRTHEAGAQGFKSVCCPSAQALRHAQLGPQRPPPLKNKRHPFVARHGCTSGAALLNKRSCCPDRRLPPAPFLPHLCPPAQTPCWTRLPARGTPWRCRPPWPRAGWWCWGTPGLRPHRQAWWTAPQSCRRHHALRSGFTGVCEEWLAACMLTLLFTARSMQLMQR